MQRPRGRRAKCVLGTHGTRQRDELGEVSDGATEAGPCGTTVCTCSLTSSGAGSPLWPFGRALIKLTLASLPRVF